MGLDSYLLVFREEDNIPDVCTDLSDRIGEEIDERYVLKHWRSSWILHDCMYALFCKKHGRPEDGYGFNVTAMRLDLEDIERLLKEIKDYPKYEWTKPNTRKKVKRTLREAAMLIFFGLKVHYYAWF